MIATLLFTSCATHSEDDLVKSVAYAFDRGMDISTVESLNLTPISDPKIGPRNGWYWFKIELENVLLNDDIVFNIEGNSIKTIHFYNDGKEIIQDMERLTMRSHSFKAVHSTNTYYVHVQFNKQAYFPVHVYSLENYYQLENRFLFSNGLYYGFVIIVLLINLVLYFSLKDWSFLTYVIFLGLTTLGITDFDGLMGLYTSPEVRFWLSTLLHFGVPAAAALFTSTILGHHKTHPRSMLVTGVLLCLSAVCYLTYIAAEEFLFFAIGDLIGLVIVTYYMYLGITELKKQRFAKFTVCGYCLIWISAIFYMMPLNFGISEPFLSIQTVKMGSIVEMLVLTYSIIYRMKLLQIENREFSRAIKIHMQQIFELENQLQSTSLETKEVSIEDRIAEIAASNNLTARETDVLLQIILGLTNPEIAEKLSISVNTVKYHTKNIYEKLDVKKRGELPSRVLLPQ